MGRPEKLTEDIIDEITDIIKKFPKMKAPKVREDIRKWLTENAKKEDPGMTEQQAQTEAEDQLPGKSAIQKLLKKLKDNKSTLDKPWSIGSSIKQGMPSEVVPVLVDTQRFLRASGLKGVTIRQARWYAYLHPKFRELIDRAEKKHPGYHPPRRWLYELFNMAGEYAARERMSEITSRDYPDTTDLDEKYFVDDTYLKKLFSAAFEKNNNQSEGGNL